MRHALLHICNSSILTLMCITLVATMYVITLASCSCNGQLLFIDQVIYASIHTVVTSQQSTRVHIKLIILTCHNLQCIQSCCTVLYNSIASSPGPLSRCTQRKCSHFFACNIKSWERGLGDKAIILYITVARS